MISTKVLYYFDHNATTPVSKEVLEALPEFAQSWGNPSSIHWGGRQPKNILRDARKALAEALNCSPLELVFTSGGSESNNTVIKGVFDHFQSSRCLESGKKSRFHYITTQVEHPSVMKSMEHLEKLGAKVSYIPVDRQGRLDMDFYKEHLSEETALVSVMYANNETGTLFPIREMTELAHQKGALFHMDAVQGFGKDVLDFKSLGIDFASISGHKFYSIKGSGALFIKKGHTLPSLICGGGQERHRRGGTENTLGIGAMGVMAKKASLVAVKSAFIGELRDHMEARILSEISEVKLTAAETPRLSNTSSLVIAGIDGETLLMSLDLKGFAVSTGAACSAGNPEPSPVLLAMGLSRAEAQSSLRVSLGWENTLQEVDLFVETLKSVVERLRALGAEEGVSKHV